MSLNAGFRSVAARGSSTGGVSIASPQTAAACALLPLPPPAAAAAVLSAQALTTASTLSPWAHTSAAMSSYGAACPGEQSLMITANKKAVGSTNGISMGGPGGSKSSCPLVPVPQLSRASFHVGYYVPPSIQPGDPYGGLEQNWNQHFEVLFRNLPNVWFFGPCDEPPEGWCIFKDMAKVRFSCQMCQHGWTSMYGLVVFFYHWDTNNNQGDVRFMLTGQKCNQCSAGGFETPMWYPEEAQKVMTNLYHEVAGKIYKLQTPPIIRDRRHGRPRQQHNSSMCEGCHQGICKTNKNTT